MHYSDYSLRAYIENLKNRKTGTLAKVVQPDPDNLKPILEAADLKFKEAIRNNDYETCRRAVELFKQAAYLPAARETFIGYLSQASIPLLDENSPLLRELNNPKIFIERAKISEYHFRRYFCTNRPVKEQSLAAETVVSFPKQKLL